MVSTIDTMQPIQLKKYCCKLRIKQRQGQKQSVTFKINIFHRANDNFRSHCEVHEVITSVSKKYATSSPITKVGKTRYPLLPQENAGLVET
jgi:hypothetical protein